MGDVLEQSTSWQRFNMLLMTVFACGALLLAALGICGLVACSEQRTAGSAAKPQSINVL